jgi:thioredoxin
MPEFIEATEQNWSEIVRTDGPVLVDFWAPWCGWCRKLAPAFEHLASEYAGRLRFVKVNVENETGIATRYGVQGLPTLKFLCDGQVLDEVVGYLPEPRLRRWIDEALAKVEASCAGRSNGANAQGIHPMTA